MSGLLILPDIVLEKILSYLNYDDIAKYRIVCKVFDTLCQQRLNKGFVMVEKHHSQYLKAIKSQLPRRESERRNHPLARHSDILTAIENRLSMLSMTFTKYIDAGLCCFIPGKVIDEIYRILRNLKVTKTPGRAHEVLQELRDISSMAMEYFDEKIVPILKLSYAICRTWICVLKNLVMRLLSPIFSHIRTIGNLSLKLRRYSAQLTVQAAEIRQQKAKIAQQSAKLTEQDVQIAELKRHLEEWDHKFDDLSAKLNRAREETGAITESNPNHDLQIRNYINRINCSSHALRGLFSSTSPAVTKQQFIFMLSTVTEYCQSYYGAECECISLACIQAHCNKKKRWDMRMNSNRWNMLPPSVAYRNWRYKQMTGVLRVHCECRFNMAFNGEGPLIKRQRTEVESGQHRQYTGYGDEPRRKRTDNEKLNHVLLFTVLNPLYPITVAVSLVGPGGRSTPEIKAGERQKVLDRQ
ncbi:hypothetical protein L9F63_018268, partial [Diploptera punctata]